jgi:hypothetical protein
MSKQQLELERPAKDGSVCKSVFELDLEYDPESAQRECASI